MKRIGIYGGTFDPPHQGHVAVACGAVEAGLVDEVWLLVSPQNPLKKDKHISAEDVRLRMAYAAVDDAGCGDKVKVSDFEFSLPRPSYSYNTLCRLREAFPDCQFTLMVGADNAASFSAWKYPDEILQEFGLIVYPRPGYEMPENLKNTKVLEDVKLFPVSSTSIRDAVKRGEDVSEMISPRVAEIIKKESLYGN